MNTESFREAGIIPCFQEHMEFGRIRVEISTLKHKGHYEIQEREDDLTREDFYGKMMEIKQAIEAIPKMPWMLMCM